MGRLRAGQTGSLLGVHLTTGEQGSIRAGEESQREGGWQEGPISHKGVNSYLTVKPEELAEVGVVSVKWINQGTHFPTLPRRAYLSKNPTSY